MNRPYGVKSGFLEVPLSHCRLHLAQRLLLYLADAFGRDVELGSQLMQGRRFSLVQAARLGEAARITKPLPPSIIWPITRNMSHRGYWKRRNASACRHPA